MRALTLKQPWASLMAIGAKKWETRSWKPSTAMHYILQRDGMLIHSSATISKDIVLPHFHDYVDSIAPMPFGKILCWVKVGRIIPTDQWMYENRFSIYTANADEKEFGNYESGRWAWETTDLIKFETPVAAKGSLSLWDCTESFPELIPQPPQ